MARYKPGEKPQKSPQNISLWFQKIVMGVEVEEVHGLIIDFLNDEPWLALHLNQDARRYLTDRTVDEDSKQDTTCNTMCCSEGIDIQVGTVHSVKGETHTATMLMESNFYGKHESEYLMAMMKGKTPKLKKREAECTKITHVAMSRPTLFFVMACHEDRVSGHEVDLKANGWVIVTVNEVLAGQSDN